MSHSLRMTDIRQNLRSKKQNHETIQKRQFQSSNADFKKLFEAILRNCKMNQKSEKRNNIINDYFIIENA